MKIENDKVLTWRCSGYQEARMKLVRCFVYFLAIAFVSVASIAAAQNLPATVPSELAMNGKLRVGLNLTNSATVTKDPETGELRGIAVDLSRSMASAMGVVFEPVPYPSAAKMVEGAGGGEWDMAFMAIDPARARVMAFTAPYMLVPNTYMVPPRSSIRTIADVDRPGVRIAVDAQNATDLFLSRNLRQATLVRVTGEPAALELLRTGHAEVLATGRGLLLSHAANWPGARVLEGWFLAVEHAIGVPTSRIGGLAYLQDFMAHAKRSGQVQQMLDRQGVLGLIAAPDEPTK